jgi:hypothetical protein
VQVEALREVLGKVAEPYREIAGYLDQLHTIARAYFRLLGLESDWRTGIF